MKKEIITVLIIDDHDLIRESMKFMIASWPDVKVIGEANQGEDGLDLAASLQPDVVLLDISMPGGSGLQVAREIKKVDDNIAILMLTMHDSPDYVNMAIKSGCDGYALKSDSADELQQAIRTVMAGDFYLNKELSCRLDAIIDEGVGEGQAQPSVPLTKREKEVCRLFVQHWPTKDIGTELQISPKTVRVHLANIKEKFGCISRQELIMLLYNAG